MKHGIVYSEDGIYAAWPANHGGWQWEEELLFGFIRGKYGRSTMHNVVGKLEKVLARSKDGGYTWIVEVPNVDFSAAFVSDKPSFSLSDAIIRICGVYDHGGDDCALEGGFYLSHDRGHTWDGAYGFGLSDFQEPQVNTSRTAVLGDLVFLSANQKGHFGTDHVLVCRHDGNCFEKIGILEDEDGRIVMPSPVRVGRTIILAARRRAGYRTDCWIDAYASHDEGKTWNYLSKIADTGGYNGNPPALIEVSGKLICAFANRSDRAMFISISTDMGNSWSERIPIRKDGDNDIGYPRLFKVGDDVLCIYYWADKDKPQQHIAWTRFYAEDISRLRQTRARSTPRLRA